MSTAAVTAPGSRNAFLNNKRTIRTHNKSTKKQDEAEKPVSKTKKDRKAITAKKKSNSKDEDDIWMEHANQVIETAVSKLNKEIDVPKPHAKAKSGDTTQQPDSNETSNKIIAVAYYEEIQEEKQMLRDENVLLQKRVQELEAEITKVVNEFRVIRAENEKLRNNLNAGTKQSSEPYSRVFEDREILREAETGYRKQIRRLEQEITDSHERYEKLSEKCNGAEAKFQKLKSQNYKATVTKLTKDKETLEKQIDMLNTKVKELESKDETEQTIYNTQPKSQKKRQPPSYTSDTSIEQSLDVDEFEEPHEIKPLHQPTTKTPVRKTGTRANHSRMIKVTMKPKYQDTYRDKFLQKTSKFEYEYRLPDADLVDW